MEIKGNDEAIQHPVSFRR